MSRKALVLLVCCCDFRDGAERLIPSKSLGNAVIRAFPGLFRILRMCAPRRAAAVVRPRGREKSADRRRRILISRLLIIRASVPRRKSPFPAYFKGFPAVSPLIPPYPAFLKYPVSPQYELLLLLWVIGAIFLLTRFFLRYIGEKRRIDRLFKQKNQAIQDLLDMLRKDKKIHIQVLCCPNLSTPCGIGLFRRQILLPSQEYTEEELFHILRHEQQHFQTHDLLVKWMIRVFQCLFWWNPLVYLLGKDLDQVLEIKCDLAVVKNYSKKETVAYMRIIKNQLKRAMEMQETVPVGSASLIGNFAMSNVEERFSYIAASLKPTERKELPKPVFAVLFAALIMASYSFVLQSSYEAPELDENGEKIQYMQEDEIKLLHRKDGSYQEIYQNESVDIPSSVAEELIQQGVTVIEE